MLEVKKKRSWRPFAGAVIVISIAAIAGQSVIASLNATAFNDKVQNVNSGTMKLDLANSGNGFGTTIANLVPGDVVNRYVTLTNTGSISGTGLSLRTEQTPSDSSLINNGTTTKALKLTVTSCSSQWDTVLGTCNGSTTGGVTEISSRTLGSFSTNQPFVNGDLLPLTGTRYLQIKIELPEQSETTQNGNLPLATVQGKSLNITYIFDLAQRQADIKNS